MDGTVRFENRCLKLQGYQYSYCWCGWCWWYWWWQEMAGVMEFAVYVVKPEAYQ